MLVIRSFSSGGWPPRPMPIWPDKLTQLSCHGGVPELGL